MKTIQAAQSLQQRGHQPEQVIGFMAQTSAYLAPIVFASFCIGCPINALATTVEKQNVIKMLRKTEPCVMFCDIEVYDLVKECLNELGNEAEIFTFNGRRDGSEPVESLFHETRTEHHFM